MRIFLILLTAAGLYAVDFPSQITLSNGKTLRNTSFIRWQGDTTVVVKHAGGAAPLQLRYLAEKSRAAIEAYRQNPTAASTPSSLRAQETKQQINGQMFLVTLGAGNYLFGGQTVWAFPAKDHGQFIDAIKWSGLSRLSSENSIREKFNETLERWKSRAVAEAQTDGEGRFTIETTEPVFLVSTAQRYRAGTIERYEWVVLPEANPAILTNQNMLDSSLLWPD